MDLTHIYRRTSWNALPQKEAETILSFLVKTQLSGFTITSFEEFNKFNQHTFTAVLDYQGSEFVFVPGDTVTLGLDHYEMTAENQQHIAALTGLQISEIPAYMKERLSPLRTVNIAPMVVERTARETGYFSVAMDDERLVGDDYFKKAREEVLKSPGEKYTYTVNDSFRLSKNGRDISAFLYEGATYDELVNQVSDSGFRLPTEDEWEYLSGGGARTMYPWGDRIDRTKKYHHFAADHAADVPYFLDTYNHFGIVIANNPYHYEIMMDSEWFLKGGDGGCDICGGGGLEIGYLSTGTYYRDPGIFDEEMNYKEEITGDYSFVRRIKRLA